MVSREPVLPVSLAEPYRRLYNMLNIESLGATPPPSGDPRMGLLTWIRPTVSMDSLLTTAKSITEALSSVTGGATAWIEGALVPQGKRWWIHSVRLVRNSGDNTVDQFAFTTGDGVEAVFSVLASAVYNYGFLLSHPVALEEGSSLDFRAAGAGSSATVFQQMLWVEEQDAFQRS